MIGETVETVLPKIEWEEGRRGGGRGGVGGGGIMVGENVRIWFVRAREDARK